MFGIGVPELILILVVGLIVFGPGKLPEMGRTLGKGIREFRKASNALTQAINTPDPPPAQAPAHRAEQSAPPDAQITPTAETAAAAVAVHQAAENKEHIGTAAKEQSAAEQKTESKSSAAS